MVKEITCPTCKGSGVQIEIVLGNPETIECETCGGFGVIPDSTEEERIKTHIRYDQEPGIL